jgi:hypothetical protein
VPGDAVRNGPTNPATAPSFFSVRRDAPTFAAALRQLPKPLAGLWTAVRTPRKDGRLVAVARRAGPEVPGVRARFMAGLGLDEAARIDLASGRGAPLREALEGTAEGELSGWARRRPSGPFEVLRAN